MQGKTFVTAFLFTAGAFFLFALLFSLYPPAANSPFSLLALAVYAAIAVWVVRKVARK